MKKIRLATRASPLALWQTEFVAQQLREQHPGLQTELVKLTTRGDRILDRPLAEIGGKGLFLKELEVALLEGDADIAVHSLKDVPAEMPEGLSLPVVLERHNPLDALVSGQYPTLDELPNGAIVGTSSLRRQAQLLAYRPDLEVRPLRGNVNTRLAKLDAGEYDAIVLAAAGLERLQMAERIAQLLPADLCLPAASQGVIGIECREADDAVLALIEPLHHEITASRIAAERRVSLELGGSCRVPLAAFSEIESSHLSLTAVVSDEKGQEVLKVMSEGNADQPQNIALDAVQQLRSKGADAILARFQS